MSYEGFPEPNVNCEEITDDEYCSDEEDTCENDYSYNENTEYTQMLPENQKNDSIDGSEFTCDTCDRSFQHTYAYQKHMTEHTVCNIDGCTFTAHEKIVSAHIKTQHDNGLYYKICNLSTPEDIKRWREERKRHYPSKENIAKRQEKQQEMLARGERLVNSKNARKDKHKLKRVKQKYRSSNDKIKKASAKKFFSKKKSLINEQSDWNGPMCPFKGTKDLYKTETVKENDTFEDTEWEQERPVNNEITITNALGILMGAYSNFSDDSDSEHPLTGKLAVTNNSQIVKPEKCSSDDEMPLHAPIAKLPLPIFENEKQNVLVEKPESKANDDGCKREKRKRVHNKKTKKLRGVQELPDNKKDIKQKFSRRRITLLERLLVNDIRHERNVLLQCVRHVVNKNYFRA